MVGGACVPWQIPWDTVNERAVRILLECILVLIYLYIFRYILIDIHFFTQK